MVSVAVEWLLAMLLVVAGLGYFFGGLGIVATHFSGGKKLTQFGRIFFCFHYYGIKGAGWLYDKVQKYSIVDTPAAKPVTAKRR